MARFTLISAILYLSGLLIRLNQPQSVFGVLEEAGLAGLAIAIFYYLYRIFKRAKRMMLWKVRNKIIISYAFVGLIPVLILVLMGLISFRLIFGQVSALYLDNEIQLIVGLVEDTQNALVVDFYAGQERSAARLKRLLDEHRNSFTQEHPGLENLWIGFFEQHASRGAFKFTGASPGGSPAIPALPVWAQSGFHGLVNDGGRLYFRSVTPLHTTSPAILALQLPFDDHVVSYIEERTSIVLNPPLSVRPSGEAPGETGVFQGGGEIGTINWMHFVYPVDWITGSTMRLLEPSQSLFAITVPLDKLYYDFYFQQETNLGQILLTIMTVGAIIFVLVEAFSLLIGIVIARTITRSIQNLYQGTRRIQQGDFGYTIASRGVDQLDTLADAFNQMSQSISGLMNQLGEKERLEKEIEIAREVQTQLFPRRIPHVRRLQLAGLCLPARTVSGDYYDFMPFGEEQVDVVIGDISGKGISAALLMASLQSAIRTHVIYRATSQGYKKGHIGQAVAEINRHLYANTAADKFATMVFSHFDSASLQLTYCNAGHNPPLLISNGDVGRLSVGGMAVGLFEDCEYEEETVKLKGNDLLIFYTDGVVEAEDPQGEQFGEEKLIELVRKNAFLTSDDIQKLILDEVDSFAKGLEQRDDITVVVMRVGE